MGLTGRGMQSVSSIGMFNTPFILIMRVLKKPKHLLSVNIHEMSLVVSTGNLIEVYQS